MTDAPQEKSNKGIFAVIAVLAVVAIVALVYLSGNIEKETASENGSESGVASMEPAAQEGQGANEQQMQNADATAAAEDEAPKIELKPGNPVVAVVNGEEIKRTEVFEFIAGLPQNVRQMPLDQLFELSVQQLVNARLVENKAEQAALENDEQVKEQVAEAREQIVRNVYLQRQVQERITDEKLQSLYKSYSERIDDIEETKASHILVETREKAEELINKLKQGGAFDEMAKENSTGPSAERGGDLGWFAKSEMVPEFSEAAFNMEPGQVSDKPVKTQFGWHVIKVEDRRNREAPPFEEVKPMLENQLRRQVLDNMVEEWRQQADVEVYGINGPEDAAEAGEEGKEENTSETSGAE